MDLQYAEIDASYRAASLVILNTEGQTWSPAANEFVDDYPADCRIPFVRPKAHTGTILARVENLPDVAMHMFIADQNGSFIRPVPFPYVEAPINYSAVLSDSLPD